MKRALILKAMAVSMGLAASLWTGRAIAEEEFGTLAGIEAQVISPSEMAAVEGKLFEEFFSDDFLAIDILNRLPFFSGDGIPLVGFLSDLDGIPFLSGSSDGIPGLSLLSGLSGGGLGDGGAIFIFDPKRGLLSSRQINPDLGLLAINPSGLTPPELRPKNNSAIGVLGPDGLLFDINAGRKAPLMVIQLEGLNIGNLGN